MFQIFGSEKDIFTGEKLYTIADYPPNFTFAEIFRNSFR